MPLVTRQVNQGNLFNVETEPPDWLAGDLWVTTSTGELNVNVGGTASEIGPSIVTCVIKSVDETIQTDTVLSNDSELLAAVTANTNYYWVLMLNFTTPNNADLKLLFTAPAGAVMKAAVQDAIGAYNAGVMKDVLTEEQLTTGNNTDMNYILQGSLEIGATAGTVNFQWAQNTSQATDTTVREGSAFFLIETS